MTWPMPGKKKPHPNKPTIRVANGNKRGDELFSIVCDFGAAYDAEDNSPGMLADYVESALSTLKKDGIRTTRDEVVELVARARGLTADELHALLDGAKRADAAATKGRKEAPRLQALKALVARGGRHGLTLDDGAAKVVAGLWSQIAGKALGELFASQTDLRLTNVGPVGSLAGLERASKLTWLEIAVTPDCDLSPLAKLPKLTTLKLFGLRADLGALAKLKKTTTLAVETTARGLGELAKMPALRVLELTVAPTVPLAGLLALPKLNLVTLLAGERPLDPDVVDTMKTLAKKRKKVWLALHEKWPEALAAQGIGTNVGWRVEIN